MDVMGGIADYSGSRVLQMPIREQATVQAAFRNDDLLRVFSSEGQATFTLNIRELPEDLEAAGVLFQKSKGGEWAAYVAGCLLVLAQEKGLALRGIDFHIQSDVPIGKGVSSSAALEIATMRALAALYRLDFQGTEMAILAQRAENFVVGSPCGLMDQLASCFGEPGRLLPIQCQPDRLLPLINLPENVAFVGMDSGVRHAVSGASYTDVRTAAFMGFSIIAQSEGCTPADIRRARLGNDASHLPFGGYLCNIAPSVFEKKYAPLLPERVSGKDFLEKFKETHDPVTQVEPMKFYAVKSGARHPVYENLRVRIFGELLRQPLDFETLSLLGELMYQSHESYTACGLGNSHTDQLVEMVRSAGKESGVFGAKITGGGSGGTVCVLCFGEEGLSGARAIFDSYRRTHGWHLKFIH